MFSLGHRGGYYYTGMYTEIENEKEHFFLLLCIIIVDIIFKVVHTTRVCYNSHQIHSKSKDWKSKQLRSVWEQENHSTLTDNQHRLRSPMPEAGNP